MLPLKRSPAYMGRIRYYANNLAERYGVDLAEIFLQVVENCEQQIRVNNSVGTAKPYILAGENVILRELYFESGPAKYILIYEILDDCIALISLWHGLGSRSDGVLIRLWK